MSMICGFTTKKKTKIAITYDHRPFVSLWITGLVECDVSALGFVPWSGHLEEIDCRLFGIIRNGQWPSIGGRAGAIRPFEAFASDVVAFNELCQTAVAARLHSLLVITAIVNVEHNIFEAELRRYVRIVVTVGADNVLVERAAPVMRLVTAQSCAVLRYAVVLNCTEQLLVWCKIIYKNSGCFAFYDR